MAGTVDADQNPKALYNSPACGWLDTHGDALFGFAMLRVRDPDVAEDLLQETLLAAMSASFDGRSTERTWMIGILRHKIADFLRRTVREESIEEAPPDTLDFFNRRGKWKSLFPPGVATHAN